MLREAGIVYEQRPADFDEEALDHSCPREFVYCATEGKAASALKLYGDGVPLLCADTVVTADDHILRKPKDLDDARRILNRQSGNSVGILTCTILHKKNLRLIDLSETRYFFDPFDPDDLEVYLQQGDWRGKAGGCMVEGFCKRYIREVRGFESTAMGLTLEAFLPFLEA